MSTLLCLITSFFQHLLDYEDFRTALDRAECSFAVFPSHSPCTFIMQAEHILHPVLSCSLHLLLLAGDDRRIQDALAKALTIKSVFPHLPAGVQVAVLPPLFPPESCRRALKWLLWASIYQTDPHRSHSLPSQTKCSRGGWGGVLGQERDTNTGKAAQHGSIFRREDRQKFQIMRS